MKRSVVLVILVFSFLVQGFSQNQKPLFSSNSSLTFETFFSGVRYADIMLSAPNQEQVDKREGIAGFYYLAQRYLRQLGFEYVALTSEEKTQLEVSIQSYCELTSVYFSGDIDDKSISNRLLIHSKFF